MPFKIFHNDKLIGSFEDRLMEPYMANWDTQYVSGQLNLHKETLTIWIENKIITKRKEEK